MCHSVIKNVLRITVIEMMQFYIDVVVFGMQASKPMILRNCWVWCTWRRPGLAGAMTPSSPYSPWTSLGAALSGCLWVWSWGLRWQLEGRQWVPRASRPYFAPSWTLFLSKRSLLGFSPLKRALPCYSFISRSEMLQQLLRGVPC